MASVTGGVLWGALLLGTVSIAVGQQNTPRASIAPEALAWWSFDPTAFAAQQQVAPERQIMLGGLRAAVGSGLFGDGASAQIVEGLLVAGSVGGVPHTLALLDFAAQRGPDGAGMNLDRLVMVLELRTTQDHAQLLRTIRTILIDAAHAKAEGRPGSGHQRRLVLPGGKSGVAYTEPGWDAWREISWCSIEDRFLVGLGPDALARWLQLPGEHASGPTQPPWNRHRAAVDECRPDGRVFFEAYLDLEALHRGFPSAFVSGRTPRMRSALGLDRAHQVMLHGRFLPPEVHGGVPLIALDRTQSENEFGDGPILHQQLSTSNRLDQDLPLSLPAGSYAMFIPFHLRDSLERALDIYSATVQDSDLAEFNDARNAWMTKHEDALETLSSHLSPWLYLTDAPTPVLPVPGLCSVFANWSEDAHPSEIVGALEAIFSDFEDQVGRDGENIWSLRIDEHGLMRIPAWGLHVAAGEVFLIGGWGYPVITENRAFLADQVNQRP